MFNLKNRSIRKQILITEESNEHLKMVSENIQKSQNEIINLAIESYLKRYKRFWGEDETSDELSGE